MKKLILLALFAVGCDEIKKDHASLNIEGSHQLLETCINVCKLGVSTAEVRVSEVICRCVEPSDFVKAKEYSLEGQPCYGMNPNGSLYQGRYDKRGNCENR